MNANSAVEVALLILIVFLAGALIGYLLRRWLRPEKPGADDQATKAPPSRIADATAGAANAAGATPIAQMASDPGSEDSDTDGDGTAPATEETHVEPVPAPAKAEEVAPAPVATPVTPPAAPDEIGGTESGRPVGLDAPRDGTKDDLRKIKGIGPKIEGTLNGLGIYHYDQIAGWDRTNVAWVDEHLSFKGRIDREEWIAQARGLADQN